MRTVALGVLLVLGFGFAFWLWPRDEHERDGTTAASGAGSRPASSAATPDTSPAPRLRGMLQDEAGSALEGWTVLALPGNADPHGVLEAKSAASGRFAMECRAGIAYSVRVQEPGSSRWIACTEAASLLPSQREVVVTIRARDLPSAFVSGRVVDATGGPAALVPLALGEPWELRELRLGSVDRAGMEGQFRIGPLAPGSHVLRTCCLVTFLPNVTPAELARFELAPKEDKDLGTLRVPDGTVVAYRFVDRAGEEISWGGGWITTEEGAPIGSLLDGPSHGEVRLLPGRYLVQVGGFGSWAWKSVPLQVDTAGAQSLDLVCDPAVSRDLRIRWPVGHGPKRKLSARFSFLLPHGDTWECRTQVEPEDDTTLNPCLAKGRHLVTVRLEDGALYMGRFDVASLEPKRGAISVPLELVR